MTESSETRPRRGRRTGHPDTRGTILSAAHLLFTSHGFNKTSIRAIARDAGVDPALVHHYFSDKVELLLATIEFTLDPRRLVHRVTRSDRRTLGWRLVATLLKAWESPLGATLVQVVRNQPALFHAFAAVISANITEVVTHDLGLTRQQATARLAMVETIVGGIFMTRYVARMEPMASLSAEEITRIFGPLVQQAIDQGPAS